MAPGWPSGSFRSSWATLRVFSTSYEDLAWNHLFWCVCIYLIYLIYFHLCILNAYIYHSITLSASVSIRIYRSLGTIILTSHSRNGRPDSGDLPVILSYFRSLMALGLHQVLRKSGGSSPNQCWEIEQESNWGWPWFWMILTLPGCQFSLWHRNTCGKPLQSLGSCSML